MKRIFSGVALAALAVLVMGAAVGSAGTWIFKTRSDQTAADTKIAEFVYGADGTTKASVDIEGDVVAAKGTFSDAVSGPSAVVSASSGTTALTAAQSGAVVANTGTSATTTFTLPAAAAGLHFCFVEAGDAAGELLITPASGDKIVGKTHAAENGTGIAPAAGTGIKNTAASNVKGDHCCLHALDATTWMMTSVAGVWASQ